MVRAVLGAAGYRVGTMPKPHLVSYRERVAIDGEPISASDFAAAVAHVLPAIDRVAAGIGPPTEFEALTAAAISELARRRVDVAIVEVGMAGEPTSPSASAAAAAPALPAIDRVAAGTGRPTEFEALTAGAISELARRRVEVAIVEVGMAAAWMRRTSSTSA